jgi:hypothetical protein
VAGESRERLARKALTFARAPSGRDADLNYVRRVVAGASDAPSVSEGSAAARAIQDLDDALVSAALTERSAAPDALEADLDELVSEPTEGPTAIRGIEAPEGYDVSIRSVPFKTSTNPLATPAFAAGRRVERTIGPVRDSAGREIWIDLLLRERQMGVVRGAGADPLLLVPVRGPRRSGASIRLGTGSVWIQARLLAPAAPPGAYCGIRIKGGRLRLSAAATSSGGNLVIGAGDVATLEIETDPVAASTTAGAPGADGHAARSDPPATARFVFEPAGGRLDAADDAEMRALGTTLKLVHRIAPADVDPLINRVVLSFDLTPPTFVARRARSELFAVAGEAPIVGGGWALPLTIAAPASLGAAAGVGGLAAVLGPGLESSWRGLAGGPVPLEATVVLAESGRLALAGRRRSAPTATQTIDLWNETGAPGRASVVQLDFPAGGTTRLFSEGGTVDAVQLEGGVDATLDRPVRVDGSRFPLRSETGLTALWQLPTGFGALVAADVTATLQRYRSRPYPMALTNALLQLSGPTVFVATGTLLEPQQMARGVTFVLFGVRGIIPSLRDPYVTNVLPPLRQYGRRLETRAGGGAKGRLLAATTWETPTSPVLSLTLLPVGGQPLFATAAPSADPGTIAMTARSFVHQPDAEAEDREVEVGLRQVFERAAGPTREQLVLVDVSSNIDQLGVGFGAGRGADERTSAVVSDGLPIRIDGLDLSAPIRNLRVVLLPQFQWEPVINIPNPLVLDPYPDVLASADDGGPTVLGSASVTLVPIAPERVTKAMLSEFSSGPDGTRVAAKFTLPFGMKAAAVFQPFDGRVQRWSILSLVRPATADARYVGGLQIAAEAFPERGPDAESPSFPGAAWQTRNGVDPGSGMPFGLSVLSAGFGNPGVEWTFNTEMGPGRPASRVPITRVDFSGYGGSTFSSWANPNAVSSTSQVRFDVIVARTAYEVIQIASILYPWAVPVVRTITLERRKEGAVVRFDSGWVATGPGLYDYPDPDPNFIPPPPPEWTPIETHPGVVAGAWNVRRIRETGRILNRSLPSSAGPILVELLEVRFDADFDIEGAVQGRDANGRVTGRDQVGFVQRSPQGYPLMPEHLAAMMEAEGPFGGALDCVVDIGGSGQLLSVKRVDVAPAPPPYSGPPQFGAAARGAVALPGDGQWSAVRHDLSAPEPQPVNAQSGVALVRAGTASGSAPVSEWYRLSEPIDLLRENSPTIEFGLVQGSDAHRVLFPRPRIRQGEQRWSSSEVPALAETYTLSLGVGIFPPRGQCLLGALPWGFDIGRDGRFTLSPTPTMEFTAPPAVADRLLVDGAAFKIRTRYEDSMSFTLDAGSPQSWRVEGGPILTTMDLGPFTELLGVRHRFSSVPGAPPAFERPEMVYPPVLAPVVEILEFLAELLGVDQALGVEGFKGSFKFKATLNLPIENPSAADKYFDFGGMEIKGKLKVGISSAPSWNGFLRIDLGARVPVLPPILGGGEIGVELAGTALTEQKVTIQVKWSASVGKSLGPIEVKGSFSFGIQVIVSTSGAWQIGLLVAISASADVWIVKITVKVELMAAISVLADGSKQALGQAKFAAEIEVCWFLTVSVEYSLEYREALTI